MSKKNFVILSVALLAVAGFYLYLYKDSFQKPIIRITLTIRPKRSALIKKDSNLSDPESLNLNFALDHEYKLTSVKVVPVEALKTNKNAAAIWELTSDSNSAPVRTFAYGKHIAGMHTAIKGAVPEPLTPNTTYSLLIEAGKKKGQHDFAISEDEHLIK